MQYTTLGKTGLRVSVAGLGTGGFSRMGLKSGLNEDQSARLVLDAIDLGVNFIDTAPPYGTEGVVGKALKAVRRDSVVVATKSTVLRDGQWWTPERMVASLDNSLRLLGTDYIDVFNLHGIEPDMYDHARNVLAPALIEQKQKGKIRHIGLTENPIVDFTNETLKRALNDPIWEVFMVGFHMMHQGARQNVFPLTQQNGVGTLIMFAVRSIFADPPRVAREIKALAAKGLVDKSLGRDRRSTRLSGARRWRRQHDRRRLPVRASRAGSRRGAVRHRQRRAPAQQYRLTAQAAFAGSRPRQACDAVRPTEGRRPRRPSWALTRRPRGAPNPYRTGVGSSITGFDSTPRPSTSTSHTSPARMWSWPATMTRPTGFSGCSPGRSGSAPGDPLTITSPGCSV